jgi:hypothetical protein
LLMVCPIGDKMAKCGHVAGKGHSLKHSRCKEP